MRESLTLGEYKCDLLIHLSIITIYFLLDSRGMDYFGLFTKALAMTNILPTPLIPIRKGGGNFKFQANLITEVSRVDFVGCAEKFERDKTNRLSSENFSNLPRKTPQDKCTFKISFRPRSLSHYFDLAVLKCLCKNNPHPQWCVYGHLEAHQIRALSRAPRARYCGKIPLPQAH